MSGRTPSFIVVGLVIIMFLLGLFYMSCTSKNTELRMSLEQFEERIRSLTIKNSDSEKKLDNIILRKRELDEEKLTIQRQMEKKDSEINDLNTKLNEKSAEIQSLKTDKNVLDEQIKEYKSMSEVIVSKNSLIEKLQKELNDAKESHNDEVNRLKQEYETLKNSQSSRNNQLPSQNEQSTTFVIPPQRFQPFISNNVTTRSIASLFQDPLNKLNNLTKEVKAQIAPAALDLRDKPVNGLDSNINTATNATSNEQQQPQNINNDKLHQEANQNVPAPPLANSAQEQEQHQPDHVESAQAAPQPANIAHEDNQVAADNPQYQQRLQRSLNNSIVDNKNIKPSDNADNENDDEEQIDADNLQQNIVPPSNSIKENDVENNNHVMNAPSLLQSNNNNNNNNYRVGNPERYRQIKNKILQEE